MLRGENNDVLLEYPSNLPSGAPVVFRGNFEPSRDDLDCVLIFDGTGFRLERQAGTVKLRQQRGARQK